MSACCYATIISANYLAFAKVLGDSLAHHEPEAAFRVLIVERASQTVREMVASAGLTAIYAEDLELPDLERLAYKYDILELNTALKPSFLKFLFAEDFERVIYVDPDIRFFGSAQPIHAALDHASIVLTPHALAPLLDGLRPSEVDFLRNGVFNLGFIGLKRDKQALAMLDWWEQRCLGLGFNDIGFGTFVDQKWANLIPAFFESVAILRHPGCNVAYWNLHERNLSKGDSSHLVNDQALVFFHFSGIDPDQPTMLSRHQNRYVLRPGTQLAELVQQYCQTLLDAGHELTRHRPYSFATLDDGTAISPTMRRALFAVAGKEADPFRAASDFQQSLRRRGIYSRGFGILGGVGKSAVINTHNLDQQGSRLQWANRAVRMLVRLLGPERAMLLLRYAALLTRESHFASVLLDLPLKHEHRERR